MKNRVGAGFFRQDALVVATELVGKKIVRVLGAREEKRFIIIETEAYRGEGDLACHASKGKAERTKVMYEEGGKVYMYLIYGIHWMLNFVTGEKEYPKTVLIRGLKNYNEPGKVGKLLQLSKGFYGEDITVSQKI